MDKAARSSIRDDIRQDQPQQSDFSKVTELLLNDDWRRRKTIINKRHPPLLSSLDVVAQLYDIDFLKSWLQYYGEWNTSGDGRGRQDIVEISKFHYAQVKEENRALIEALGRK